MTGLPKSESTAWNSFSTLARALGCSSLDLDANDLLQLVPLASAYQVVPALTGCTEASHPKLLNIGRQAAQQSLATVRQALNLTEVLNDRGMEPLFLKGTGPLLDVQSDRPLRHQADIDLLAPEDSLEEVCRALLENGYRFWVGAGLPATRHEYHTDIGRALTDSRHHHHLTPLCHPQGTVSVELHRHWLPARIQDAYRGPGVMAGSLLRRREHHRYRTPDPAHQLLHSFLGSYLGDYWPQRWDYPLRTGLDVLAMMQEHRGTLQEEALGLLSDRAADQFIAFLDLTRLLFEARDSFEAGDSSQAAERSLAKLRLRHNTPVLARCLDAQARVAHLINSALRSPGRFPAYLHHQRLRLGS